MRALPGDSATGTIDSSAVLRCPALVVVMEPTGLRELDDLTQLGGLQHAPVGRVLLEGVVAAPAVVVLEVAGKNASEVVLVEYDDGVEQLSAKCADQPLDVGILPRRPRSDGASIRSRMSWRNWRKST